MDYDDGKINRLKDVHIIARSVGICTPYSLICLQCCRIQHFLMVVRLPRWVLLYHLPFNTAAFSPWHPNVAKWKTRIMHYFTAWSHRRAGHRSLPAGKCLFVSLRSPKDDRLDILSGPPGHWDRCPGCSGLVPSGAGGWFPGLGMVSPRKGPRGTRQGASIGPDKRQCVVGTCVFCSVREGRDAVRCSRDGVFIVHTVSRDKAKCNGKTQILAYLRWKRGL